MTEIEVNGTVSSILPGTTFRVKLENGHEILASISGKLRKNFIKIGVGDHVKMDMNSCDLTKARIKARSKEMKTVYNPPKHSFGPKHQKK